MPRQRRWHGSARPCSSAVRAVASKWSPARVPMTYRGDKMREKKNEKAQACIGHDELGARRHSGETTGGENGNAPLPRLEGLGKGVEIEARSKAELLTCSIGKWCGDGSATRWQSWLWQWRAWRRLCGCESERGRGNERERANERVVAVLKPSPARLVGPTPAYCRTTSVVRHCPR